MNLDGTDTKILSVDNISQIYIQDDFIYYSSYKEEHNTLYKMNLDGGNKEEITLDTHNGFNWFYIYDGSVFYFSSDDGQGIKKMNLLERVSIEIDPSHQEHTTILSESTVAQNNTIYYVDRLMRTFNKLNLDTNQKYSRKNNKDYRQISNIYLVGNKILYYQNDIIYMMDLYGNNCTQLPMA